MSAFDDLTLAEVDEITQGPLGGKPMSDPTIDTLKLAGGVLWATQKRTETGLTWQAFMQRTKMSDIKSFALEMEHEGLNPTLTP